MAWRAKIGLIGPVESKTERAFNKYAPEGVQISTTRIQMKDQSVEGLTEFVDTMEEAAKVFNGYPQDIIIFGCTAASVIKGVGWDKECIKRLERASGSPGTTTITAVIDSFHALGIKKIAMIAPYSEEVCEIERVFLVDSGFDVTNVMRIDTSPFKGNVHGGFLFQCAREIEIKGADVLFLSCMALDTMEIIQPLETDLALPVITSHQASLWSVLRKVGVKEKIPCIGKLFEI